MNMKNNIKSQLYSLCRDINNGLFSENTLDDIVQMAVLFSKCGTDAPRGVKNARNYEYCEKKDAVRQVYFAHLSLLKYELTDGERVRCASEILGCDNSVASYALWAKYTKNGFYARDFLKIARSLLEEPFGEEYRERYDECMNRLKAIKPKVLFFGAKDELCKK